MALETGTRIADLVATNPEGATDFVAQGDDHIRLLKACIQGSLPNLGATAVTATGAEINHIVGVTSPLQAQIDAKLSITAAAAAYQPLDADLTAIAALTTTSFGRGFLDLADLAALATKINALVPTWSSLHTFTAGALVGITANGAGGGLTVKNVGSGAGTTSRISINDGTGNLGYLQGDPNGNTVSLRAVDRNDRLDFWTGVAGGALRLTISATGTLEFNGQAATTTPVLIATGTTTAAQYSRMQNTSGDMLWGVEGSAGNLLITGATAYASILRGSAGIDMSGDNGATVHQRISAAGVVSVNDAGTMREVGFRKLPWRNLGTSGSLAQSDGGKSVFMTGTGTLTGGALEDETIVTVGCIAGTTTIAPGSGTLYWFNGSGALSTGNRTLAIGGIATLQRSGSDWYIWGMGLS